MDHAAKHLRKEEQVDVERKPADQCLEFVLKRPEHHHN